MNDGLLKRQKVGKIKNNKKKSVERLLDPCFSFSFKGTQFESFSAFDWILFN